MSENPCPTPGCSGTLAHEPGGGNSVVWFCVRCGVREVERKDLLAPLPANPPPATLARLFWADVLKASGSREDADEMYRKYKHRIRIVPVAVKACKGCGEITRASFGPNTFCPACKAARSVKRCVDCGTVIEGKGVRLCGSCRKARRAITNHKYKGTQATRTCERCGEEYASHPGRNRYCLTCSPLAKREYLQRYHLQRKSVAQS